MNNYYVYIYLDQRKPGNFKYGNYYFPYEPFYVGKGTKYRKTEHLAEAYNNRDTNVHKCRIIRKIKTTLGVDPIIIELCNNLTNELALQLEIEYISLIGRRKFGGPLTNQTDGGQTSPASGSTFEETYGIDKANQIKQKMVEAWKNRPPISQETRKRMSVAHKGEKSWMYGVSKTQEHRDKISKTRLTRGTSKGENNGMFGKNHTEESKQLMSDNKKANWNEERRLQMVNANPKSRQVKTHNGVIFPSLSEAGRHFGFVGLTAPRNRIKQGIWIYID